MSLICRYTLNWVKIRVWEQVQWDGIIMIDVDVTVLGDLTHLFHLPTDFAAVPDNGKIWNRSASPICSGVTRTTQSIVLFHRMYHLLLPSSHPCHVHHSFHT